jgi:hypothetical protein
MRVQVNEAGCDYQSLDIHGLLATKGFGRDRRDFSARYSDVTNGIQPGLRIHDVPASQYEVKRGGRLLLSEYRNNADAEDQEEWNPDDSNSVSAESMVSFMDRHRQLIHFFIDGNRLM